MSQSDIVDFESAPFEIIDGDRGKNYPKKGELSDSGYCLFLSATNVTKKGFAFSERQFITEQKDEMLRKGRLQREDVILTTRGTLGNAAYFNAHIPYDHVRINSGMVILRCRIDKILPAYLYHFIRSPSFHGQVNSLKSGVAQPQLPIRDMKRVRMPLPTLSGQLRIASILSTYDDLIENNRRRIQLLEQAARLLYKEWFVHLRFPDHEHTTITNGIPEGWEEGTLGDVVNVKKGKNITKNSVTEGTVPVVAGGLTPAYFHDTANVVSPVVTISASGANSGYVNLYHEDIWASDCSYINSASTDCLYYFFIFLQSRQREIFGLQKGSAQPHVYPKDLMKLPMLRPAEHIIGVFENTVTQSFQLIRNITIQNRFLAKARDLLLLRLMNGEVTT